MKHILQKGYLRFIGVFALVGLLSGCPILDDDDDSTVTRGPTSFSGFTERLFGADPATATPVEINNLNFSFDEDPDAFDDQLQ